MSFNIPAIVNQFPNVASATQLLPIAFNQAAVANRNYSKEKNKKKDSKRPAKVAINEDLLRTHLDYEKMTTQMEKALEDLNKSFIKNLSLRSTTGNKIWSGNHHYEM